MVRMLLAAQVLTGSIVLGATSVAVAAETEPAVEGAAESAIVEVVTIEDVAVLAGAAVGIADANAAQVTSGLRIETDSSDRSTTIIQSLRGNVGILGVNQDAGTANSQANVRAIAAVLATTGALHVQAIDTTAVQQITDNVIVSNAGARSNRIQGSFDGTNGIVGVNQTTGDLNQSLNAMSLSVAASEGGFLVSMGDSLLQAVTADNAVPAQGDAGPRSDVLTDSFTGFRGVAQVTQISGDGNAVSNTLSLGVSMGMAILPGVQ